MTSVCRGARRSSGRARVGKFALALVLALALATLALPAAASAALPVIAVAAVTKPIPDLGQHRGVTVTAACSAGAAMVGGGSYLDNATNPATIPTNGLVLGGTAPSTGASPVDAGPADGAADPSHWMTVANFTGVSEAGDQAASFALCATGGPAHTIVRTAGTTAMNAAQQVDPPTLTTATCPTGDQLLGGGAVTSTPDQVNDGTTVGNSGNLKPLAGYPSNAAGLMAADGSVTATSWSAYGSAGITAATDKVTAFALCSADAATPPVAVAREDLAGPAAQIGTTTTTVTVPCPTGTQLVGGGYAVDETVGAVTGRAPQQGYHMRGSFPSDQSGAPVADGATAPTDWTTLGQNGGQTLPAGDNYVTHSFAMCATPPPPPATADLSVAVAAAPDPVVAGQPLTYALTVANAGPLAAGSVAVSDTLPAGAAFVSATPTTGSCTQSAGIVACTLGALATGASATVAVVVTPPTPGTLTNTATVSAAEPDPNPLDDSATTTTTVVAPNRAHPTLTVSAQATAVLGATITDSATLGGGAGPTGAITFDLYGPGDTACAMPLASSTATVAGNGPYAATPFAATTAGAYQWIAGYGGDPTNAPAGPGACGDPAQTTIVKAQPTLTAKAGGSTTLGGSITATATLGGGAAITGKITFDAYAPADAACATPLATSSATVSGNGLYASGPLTTTTAGTYRWVATYAGDAQNSPAGPTPCTDSAAAIAISAPPSPPAAQQTVTPPAAAPRSPAPPAAVRTFTLGATVAAKTGQITLTLHSPGRGRFTAVATIIGATTAKATARAKPIRFGTASRAVGAAGTLHLAIAPGAFARRLLRRHRTLRVSLAITFTPTHGHATTRRAGVTVTGRRTT